MNVTRGMTAKDAVQAEIAALKLQARRLEQALEARQDTDAARVDWGDVGDLAVASELLEQALVGLSA